MEKHGRGIHMEMHFSSSLRNDFVERASTLSDRKHGLSMHSFEFQSHAQINFGYPMA